MPSITAGGRPNRLREPGSSSRRPIRVLVIISRYLPDYSGAAAQQHDVLKRLGPDQVEATVLTLRTERLPRRETLSGVRVIRLGIGKTHRPARLLYVMEVLFHLLLRGKRYDVIHAIATGWPSFLAPLAGRSLAVPSVFTSTLQGSDDPASIRAQSWGGIKTRLMHLYAAVTAFTPQQVANLVGAGYPVENTLLLTCGVDDRFYVPGSDPECRRALRLAAGREDKGPVVLFIGTVVARKGVDLLVEAFRRLLARHPKAVLVVMGPRTKAEDFGLDESFVRRLQARCETTELRNHVAFLGRVDSAERKRSILQASDVLALFSENEGLGIVVLEAMASGVPPVLTPMPGVFDYAVQDGLNGRIADSRDPSELCRALDDVLSSDERRQAMASKARDTVRDRFSLDLVASQYLSLYRRLARRD